MSRSQDNIKLEPMEVKFAQVQTDCIVVEPGLGLDDLYWTFSSSSTAYYVWYNVDAGGTDPAPGGTGIEVAVLSTDSQQAVAAKVAAAIDLVAGLASLVDPKNAGRVILKNLEYLPGVHAAAGDVTGHTFVAVHDGFFHDFGYTEGDLELTMDQQILDITAHQTGTDILTALVTGMNVELAVALKEISSSNLERLIDLTTGGTFTPGAGTELRGYGFGQNNLNVLDKAGRLILHPARLPDADTSEDFCCWLAYPKVDSFAFSGETNQLINVTFRVFTDDFIDEAVNKVAIGDHTQV